MMRLQVADSSQDKIELQFGGGGNHTTLSEMRLAIDKAARLVHQEKQEGS